MTYLDKLQARLAKAQYLRRYTEQGRIIDKISESLMDASSADIARSCPDIIFHFLGDQYDRLGWDVKDDSVPTFDIFDHYGMSKVLFRWDYLADIQPVEILARDLIPALRAFQPGENPISLHGINKGRAA